MKHICSFNTFLLESKTNISPELDLEISTLLSKLAENPEIEIVDDGYIEIAIPFVTDQESKRINEIGMTFYPELLTYSDENNQYQTVPWISCNIEIEGERPHEMIKELLNHLIELLKSAGYTPFMDEDSSYNYWKKTDNKGWTKYTCFVNPDYPQGHWENHCL